MDDALLQILKSVDTPTVCDAIEAVRGKRGYPAHTNGNVFSTEPDAPAIVGFARTAKISAKFPSVESAESVRERRLNYYRHMATGPKPSVAVLEDLDSPECVGALWGEVNATIHKGFGLAGVLTNGVVRDLGGLPEGFPIIAGSVGPSRSFVHITGYGMPVTVFGLAVREGDLIHADRHGAVIIPTDVAAGLREGIERLLEAEKIVLDAARAPDFDFAVFEKAWARFEKARS